MSNTNAITPGSQDFGQLIRDGRLSKCAIASTQEAEPVILEGETSPLDRCRFYSRINADLLAALAFALEGNDAINQRE